MKKSRSGRCTHLEDDAHEHGVALVRDLVLGHHLGDHGDEDGVLVSELLDEGAERDHARCVQLGRRVQRPGQRVDDA